MVDRMSLPKGDRKGLRFNFLLVCQVRNEVSQFLSTERVIASDARSATKGFNFRFSVTYGKDYQTFVFICQVF